MDLGPHATFILASYLAVAVVLAGLIAWLLFDGARYERALKALGDRGIRRRGSAGADRDRAGS